MVIKGTADGLILEPGVVDWPAFLVLLTTRLVETGPFFRGGQVTLRTGARIVTADELRELTGLLAEHGLILAAVDTTEPETRLAADTVNVKSGNGSLAKSRAPYPRATAGYPSPAASPGTNGKTVEARSGILLRRTLRSGQAVHHDGHVVILGDVNPGAEVVASGDVLVWGRLRGLVHAGASGDPTARVCALHLNPTQLRIGEHIARPPEDDKQRRVSGPEVARVVNDHIVVEEWDQA